MAAVATSCSTMVQMERTYPPETTLPADSGRFIFVNFYDYQAPDLVKDRHEEGYAAAVKGYAIGSLRTGSEDPRAVFMIADTSGKDLQFYQCNTLSLPTLSGRSVTPYGANLLVALDSIRLWVDWEVLPGRQ
jgi:hypothetical protein